ncbi:hypothetical protein A2159_00125 [Candidatus Woesebacteria bacterium RBG_13_34_9]|uniref:TrpR like protein, YerC/YecD n=1 Tax=Candidatus Woesebacteria bacterium RBG_13_34_9 TaxID=1802477 RepID=A0A1F7X371_9BACT|nr:MAG: hypothetical protein A2159_00125 [Candidatus Woesebacteria bacterium RBG_13_34_9]
MRVSEKILNPSLKKQIEDMFIQTIADLRDLQEAKTFLTDFFNETEYEAFIKRFAISYWLTKKRSYVNIKENLKVSSATIASVQNMIEKPGFKLALKKVEAEEWANLWTERIKKFIKK